jgi:hypothetical protein
VDHDHRADACLCDGVKFIEQGAHVAPMGVEEEEVPVLSFLGAQPCGGRPRDHIGAASEVRFDAVGLSFVAVAPDPYVTGADVIFDEPAYVVAHALHGDVEGGAVDLCGVDVAEVLPQEQRSGPVTGACLHSHCQTVLRLQSQHLRSRVPVAVERHILVRHELPRPGWHRVGGQVYTATHGAVVLGLCPKL